MHCCTESAPGNPLPDELDAKAALCLAEQFILADVPYVMLCGGEPLIVPHFFTLAERLGRAGVQLKIETNGQRCDAAVVQRLAALPVRSVQVSLDADTPEVYRRQRAGGCLGNAHTACRAVRSADLPLEVTFAPTRINIHQAEAVIDRAETLGAFRFNTGRLMRIGTAARLWSRLDPDAAQYREFLALLQRRRLASDPTDMELCFQPFSIADALRECLRQPPATLLVLPNGKVKVSAALPHLCADLRVQTLQEAWAAYLRAWHSEEILNAVHRAIALESSHAHANTWLAVDAFNQLPIPEHTTQLSNAR